MNPWVTILAAVVPEIGPVISAFKALFAKHPNLNTPATIQAFVTAVSQTSDSVFDQVLAQIAADQANPPKP